MALLNRMIRNVAITGRTDNIRAFASGRQDGRWAQQAMMAASHPAASYGRGARTAVAARPPADPAETLRELTELHKRGAVTDAEFQVLRADLSV